MNTGVYKFRFPELKLRSVPVVQESSPESRIAVAPCKDVTHAMKINKTVWVKNCKVGRDIC